MIGYRFEQFVAPEQAQNQSTFENLYQIFMELMIITGGDVAEALAWMNQADQEYNLTDEDYGMGDFIQDMKDQGYISDDNPQGEFELTSKSERSIRQSALEEIFGKLKKSGKGEHNTFHPGLGDEQTTDRREFEFGDNLEQIAMTESLRNAQINHGIDNDLMMTEGDLEVNETEFKTQTSTVLMIDISHSMILYGEDRITPAKKVAMALAELITKRYPKDTLDIIVFGNDAWQIKIKDLPYLKVGPYHTNTVAGLELSMDILRKRKNNNKQIFMITDGKPTCLKKGIKYYKNPFGLDSTILNKTLNLAAQCRRLDIPVTTFMIASEPYLKQFVQEFTRVNNGNAYYSSLQGLGDLVFEDFKQKKKKRYRN